MSDVAYRWVFVCVQVYRYAYTCVYVYTYVWIYTPHHKCHVFEMCMSDMIYIAIPRYW